MTEQTNQIDLTRVADLFISAALTTAHEMTTAGVRTVVDLHDHIDANECVEPLWSYLCDVCENLDTAIEIVNAAQACAEEMTR